MASEFDLAVEGLRDALLVSPFADSFTYRQIGRPDWTITAILSRSPADAQIFGVLYVRLSDFTVLPEEGNWVIYDGRVYRVVQITTGPSNDAELSLRLDTREPLEPPE